MADIGVRAQGALSASSISTQVADSAKAELSGRTGVNLDEEAARLLQYQQVVELCAERVTRYDLGTEMDYKRRWAEEIMETEMLVLIR